jgi:hypothetical protein
MMGAYAARDMHDLEANYKIAGDRTRSMKVCNRASDTRAAVTFFCPASRLAALRIG